MSRRLCWTTGMALCPACCAVYFCHPSEIKELREDGTSLSARCYCVDDNLPTDGGVVLALVPEDVVDALKAAILLKGEDARDELWNEIRLEVARDRMKLSPVFEPHWWRS